MALSAPSFLRKAFTALSGLRQRLGRMRLRGAPTGPAPLPPVTRVQFTPDAALILLGLFQKDGRLVDFLHENIDGYSDQEIGAAARVVHRGCRQVLRDYLTVAPIHEAAEGSRVTLEPGFDAGAIRPTGNLVGDPPFTGTLVHRGWRVSATRLPELAAGHDPRILAAAEVEL